MTLRYFKPIEFEQRGLPGSGDKMDKTFLEILDEIRHRCGFPLKVSSGYRSPEYNMSVSSSGLNGPHTTGKACDILVAGEQAYILIGHALDLGITGVGINQKGEFGQRFVHLDILTRAEGYPRPTAWSYAVNLFLITAGLLQGGGFV
jgi:zinc D-Ala-D-Ala carboxypeptidase